MGFDPNRQHRRRSSDYVFVGAAIVVAFGVGFLIRGDWAPESVETGQEHEAHDQETIWTCSMHPQIQLPKAGQCPLCFMDLIPLET